jgi:hypothetical protein
MSRIVKCLLNTTPENTNLWCSAVSHRENWYMVSTASKEPAVSKFGLFDHNELES